MSDQQANYVVARTDDDKERNGQEIEKRDIWGKGWEFVLACVGFAVGLGNIWRFPYLCYKNGGGAFLIPYFIYVIGGAIPLMFLEVGMGQFMSQGNISIWNLCPVFKGIGIGTTVMVFLCNTYYIIVLAWALHFLFYSFSQTLPWATCGNAWNTLKCIDAVNSKNISGSDTVDSVVEYWERKVLMVSKGLDDVGEVQWELAIALLVAWILIYGCVFKGVKSGGKVVYFTATFPYVMLTVLLIRGVTLPGAMEGLKFYIKPDFSKLTKPQVWVDAGTQVFYSFACTCGGMVSLGSYNKYNRDFVKDCTFIAGVNVFSSIYGGCAIFSVLGYMSHASGVPIAEVAESGPGLIFNVYPKAVSLMPAAPFWAFLFFFMIILIGLDSQFVCVDAVITAILDITLLKKKYQREIISFLTCLVNFLFGLTMVTYGGIYVFQLFDYYAASGMVVLSFCFAESFVMGWIYGADKWYMNMEDMIGRKIGPWLKICWKFITPFLSLGLLVFAFVRYSPLVYNNTYVYPLYGQLIGAALALSSTVFVPLYFLYALINAPGVKLSEKWKFVTSPRMEKTLKLRQLQGDVLTNLNQVDAC